MGIEISNRSGVICPEDELISLLHFGISDLKLHPDCELDLLLVDEIEMEELHIKWMNEPGATDVLTFPMDELLPGASEPGILGDIVICPSVAARQASTASHSFAHELYVLSIHGLLHIVGYDHADKQEEKEMFDLQDSIVARWSK